MFLLGGMFGWRRVVLDVCIKWQTVGFRCPVLTNVELSEPCVE